MPYMQATSHITLPCVYVGLKRTFELSLCVVHALKHTLKHAIKHALNIMFRIMFNLQHDVKYTLKPHVQEQTRLNTSIEDEYGNMPMTDCLSTIPYCNRIEHESVARHPTSPVIPSHPSHQITTRSNTHLFIT